VQPLYPANVVERSCRTPTRPATPSRWRRTGSNLGNLAKERGEAAKAERHYERSQRWHDRMNEYLGNGSGS